ncbi:MAG TPA: DUF1203 domain-containing protein [Thermoanaerobaculia bacterium]|nr:DUF1203 domain-containing protein [Thermoanaerobaculia bacterium]
MNEAETTVPFRIVPFSPDLAARIRATRRDAAGRPVLVRTDGERHQCRACLELTEPGEAVLLLSHRPFPSEQPYAETGPIFIHERPCVPSSGGASYPAEFPRHHVVLRAYSESDEIVDAELVGEARVEDVIARLLARREIAYLHARNDGYGCYMFRVERG